MRELFSSDWAGREAFRERGEIIVQKLFYNCFAGVLRGK